MADENAILRILKLFDVPQDLHAAAMIDRNFYRVYKKHELILMRSFLKAFTQAERSTFDYDSSGYGTAPRAPSISPEPVLRIPLNDLNGTLENGSEAMASSSFGMSPNNLLSSDEIERILWPRTNRIPCIRTNLSDFDPESNSKFLSGDFARVDKALVVEGNKHLQDERDRNLRVGMPGSRS